MVEAVTVWGYAMFVWIPVSVRAYSLLGYQSATLTLSQILCIVPIALLRWVLCGIAFALSGYFLVANIYPVFASVCYPQIVSFIPFTFNVGGPKVTPVSDYRRRGATWSRGTVIQGSVL